MLINSALTCGVIEIVKDGEVVEGLRYLRIDLSSIALPTEIENCAPSLSENLSVPTMIKLVRDIEAHNHYVRSCKQLVKIACRDIEGIEHIVEVTAESLYEAVARGLATFRNTDWVGDMGRGQTTITVVVKQPELEHKVRMRDFEAWLESNGRSPAEMVLKSQLRKLLTKQLFHACVCSER